MNELIDIFEKFPIGIPVLFSDIDKFFDTLLKVTNKVLGQMFYFNVNRFLTMDLKPNDRGVEDDRF
jgi:hypothetical protein